MRKNMNWMAISGLLLIGVSVAHATDRFSVGTGANYSSGKYGTSTTTDIWSVPFTAQYQGDRWTFKLIVPYVSIRGAGNVIPGTGPVKNSNPLGRGLGHLLGGGPNPPPGSTSTTTTTSTSASGLGDVVASAGYRLMSSKDRSFALDLTGRVKFGTADANKGLGTGKNDYGLSLDTYKVLGAWTPFGGVGWTNYNSSPYIKLRNGFNANAGVDYRVGSYDSVGAFYNYRQRIALGGAVQSDFTAYWNHRFGKQLQLQSYALAGTANGSPDWGVGSSISYSF